MPAAKRKGTRVRPDPTDENGRIIGSRTTQASRKRRRAGLSMAECGYDDPESNIPDFDHAPTFHKDSIIHYSWGPAIHAPIAANKRKRRGGNLFSKSGSINLGYSKDKDKNPEAVEVNGPDRSHFFRLPLEIREMIYAYLLVHRRPILLNHDWHRVERSSPHDHVILKICKQISSEGSEFLYRNNCFHSLIRKSPARKSADNHISKDKCLPLLKNAVIGCERGLWDLSWFDRTCQCLEMLIKAAPRLDCLTLVLEPQRVLLTTTATGDRESNPVTFADFLSTRVKLMRLIRQVKCKVFNVIVRKPDVGRYLISVDMRALEFMGVQDTGEEGREALRRVMGRIEIVRRKLVGLKARFEEVFEDGEKAVREGKCRLLGPEESLTDGLALTRDIPNL